MELNHYQAHEATNLKGQGLFPSQIAERLGLPRGTVRKFFKEKRRATMAQGGVAEKEYGPGPRVPVVTDGIIEMKPVSQSTRYEEIRAMSGDGNNYTFEGVKHAQAQGVKFADIAEAWGYTMPELRAWMAGEGGKRYTAAKKAAVVEAVKISEGNPRRVKRYALTPEEKIVAQAMTDKGVEWRAIAKHLEVAPAAVNLWRMQQRRKAACAARRVRSVIAEPVIQPVTPTPAFMPNAATAPVFAIPEPVIQPVVALPQAAPPPTITNHAAVALAWTGYAAWMTRDGVKPLMFTEADVDMLMQVYRSVVGE